MRIAITYTEARYENYPLWIKSNNSEITIVELHWERQKLSEVWDLMESCDGLVLSGGVDIHPQFYGSDRLQFPNGDGIFCKERDEFEMHLFETALNFRVPVLAICRGMQLVNVALGGTLFQDLEEAGKRNHRRMNDKDDEHAIAIADDSMLKQIVQSATAQVNGAHHQAVDELSDELLASALSEDGVIEAAEWKHREGQSWMLCVQWHPERMKDKDHNPASKNICEAFLTAASSKQ